METSSSELDRDDDGSEYIIAPIVQVGEVERSPSLPTPPSVSSPVSDPVPLTTKSLSSTTFVCSACTFINPPTFLQCQICLTPRCVAPPAVSRSSSIASTSSISTMSRSSSRLTTASIDTTSDTTKASRWNCQRCSYLNRGTRAICSMCHIGTMAESRAAEGKYGSEATTTMTRTASRATSSSSSSSSSSLSSSHTSHASKRRKVGRTSSIVDEASISDEPPSTEHDDDHDEDGDAVMATTPARPARRIVSATKRRSRKKSSATAAPMSPSLAAATGALSLGPGARRSMSSLIELSTALTPIPAAAAAAPSSSSSSSSASSSSSPPKLIVYTNEDSRPEFTEQEALTQHKLFTQLADIFQRSKEEGAKISDEDKSVVEGAINTIYNALEYRSPSISSSAAASSSSSSAPVQPVDDDLRSSSCSVCYTDFVTASENEGASEGTEDACAPVTITNCGHAQLCSDCFHQYVSLKVNEQAVVPWLCCPSPGCRHPLTPTDLIARAKLSTHQLAHLAAIYLRKRLVRAGDVFVSCQTRDCPYGFVVALSKKSKKPPKPKEHTCVVCHKTQLVERGKEGELDDEFKKMIQNGTLRPCPKCAHLTLKEKGTTEHISHTLGLDCFSVCD